MNTIEYCQKASDVRKNWSMTIDSVVHNRPAFISRTHDSVAMLNSQLLLDLLKEYKYHVVFENEEDGSVTGFVEELQLVENANDEKECIESIVSSMKDYAVDYYTEFGYWSKAPNRMNHIPYIIKLLISSDDRILEDIICQNGKN